ncbi:hypothetical protein NLJ89_g4914 [Agrocybe chaxingu]|uniref:Uncharacterized protein n=1 Tax=Agrocybe chaxingu TaxID=84603 RepID=A0A9W8K207_9AGAR|nr:hypothetical protein NLJ89_g4914 [Agrocybe chaxingu]
MLFFFTTIATLATFSLATATNILGVSELDAEKDLAQYNACVKADSDTFVGIRYGSGSPETVVYSQCVPWRKNGEIITNAVFCRPATCYVFSDKECKTGPSIPFNVVVPVPFDFLNAADFVEYLGQSAYCSPNGLDTFIP